MTLPDLKFARGRPAKSRTHAPRRLTPCEEQRIYALCDQLAEVRISDVAKGLEIGYTLAVRWVEVLEERGVLQRIPTTSGRPRFVRLLVVERPELVREALKPAILGSLERRPDLVGGLSRRLRQPLDEVTETCFALCREGRLERRRVGQTWAFRLPESDGRAA